VTPLELDSLRRSDFIAGYLAGSAEPTAEVERLTFEMGIVVRSRDYSDEMCQGLRRRAKRIESESDTLRRALERSDRMEAERDALVPKCDGGCSEDDGPQEDCSLHGRPVAEVWAIVEEVIAQRDEALAKVERLEGEATRVEAGDSLIVDILEDERDNARLAHRRASERADHLEAERDVARLADECTGEGVL
jgi:hypothetical protein